MFPVVFGHTHTGRNVYRRYIRSILEKKVTFRVSVKLQGDVLGHLDPVKLTSLPLKYVPSSLRIRFYFNFILVQDWVATTFMNCATGFFE